MRPSTRIAIAALAVLALSACFTPETLPPVPSCAFFEWTGVPCAGCGMTRAFCSISHARWSAAWSYHPLSYPLYAVVLLAALWPALARTLPGIERLLRPRWLAAAAIAYALALAAFGVWRAWPLIAVRL